MKKRVFRLILCWCMVFMFVAQPVYAENEERKEQPIELKSVEEIMQYKKADEYTTEYADAYWTADNILTYVVDSAKIHYKDERGTWQDVDNSIVAEKSGEYDFTNKANDLKMYFSAKDEGLISKLNYKNYSLQYTLLSETKAQPVEALLNSGNEYIAELNKNENTVIYTGLFDGAAATAFTAGSEKMKEDIILFKNPKLTEIHYRITAENLVFKYKTREYEVHNEDLGEGEGLRTIEETVGLFVDKETGEEVFEIGKFYMFDSAGEQIDIEWNCSSVKNGYMLTLKPDAEFLASASYPVVIDPQTYIVSGSSTTYDTYASRENPDTNYYLNNYLRTGKDEPYGIRRTFLKFTLPSIPKKYPIMSARIDLRVSSMGPTLDYTMNVVRLTTNWSSSTLTWWNSPDYTSSGSFTGDYIESGGAQYCRLSGTPITKMVRRWNAGMYSNYGIKLYSYKENDTAAWQTFYSSDYSNSSYHPKLIIDTFTETNHHMEGNGYYNQGQSGGNSITLNDEQLSSTYKGYLSQAISNWNSSGADCDITISSSSLNLVKFSDLAGDMVGAYSPKATYFNIYVDVDKIDEKKEWNKYPIGVFAHEIGHALGLADFDEEYEGTPGHKYTLMGYGRDRDTHLYPTASDISGVNSIW